MREKHPLTHTHSSLQRKMMQTAIVTYPDEHQVIQPVYIPMPPSDKLAKAFQSNTVLYLHVKSAGYEYCWNKDGSVKMFDCNKGIMYEWIQKPTMKDALLNGSDPKGETTIFKKDGTVIRCARPYPFSSPKTVWTFIWPANPEILLVDGEEADEFDEWDTNHSENESECSKCSSGELPPGRSDHFYEDEADNEADEYHEHPYYDECDMRHYTKCWDKDCIPCPGCGGTYDGMDHGGLGCSRICAYGDMMEEMRRYKEW